MRFRLHLKPTEDRQKLLFNYQYPLQAWLYKILYQADQSYASFLHNQGYAVPNSHKSFKHFTFSSLQLGKTKPIRSGDTYIQLSSDSISLVVSFYIDKAAEGFIVGLFQNQEVSLFNRDYRANFIVTNVEALPNPFDTFTGNQVVTMSFRTISPMVVARKEEGLDQYLSPTDERYSEFFAINLVDRYRTIEGTDSLQVDSTIAQSLVKFKLISDPTKVKKRGFFVKEGKLKDETKVIGYHNFTFEITAPARLLEIGFLGGLGKYCAVGCGCVEVWER
ncbi:CRISPR-associated endoribonuclease Cas6 [Cellulophaga sp. BC115SP]|uniref:CRISPR-associated endoribonuclease Cas6 n=1 Tax=Cellulophaga sp. BC115SP TaxID=2683263 RepID=UPI001411E4B7|nr:CRISPR-associated endoribonuclease Cas6 [Cellulophaga sp. BC115SP]NBB30210.1 CRISPR-associated endoribonuclease Cas6 [Cellulophaga sp. BC115SP]